LMSSGRLKYLENTVVDRVAERGERVIVYAHTPGGRRHFEGARVFVGAGVFNSTAIMLRSLGWYGRYVNISDAQYYLLPLLQFHASPNVTSERLHTLAQAFLEIEDASISPHLVHLQIYGYNDLLADMLACKLGLLRRFVPRNMILGRVLVIQGYLHSSHSGHISAVLTKDGAASRLNLRPIVNPDTAIRVGRVVRHLRGVSRALGAFPIAPLLQITQPGRGFHIGGSFPMAKRPAAGQTDALGRPLGWSRIHVIDATIFPSIPATTITQTVMANAFRIGSAVARLDSVGAR
jgi:choline dehydrogenase-like flavoprotein